MRHFVWVGLLLAFSVNAESTMSSYRCGNDLVTKGMSMEQVHDLCGQFESYNTWTDEYAEIDQMDRYYNAPVKKIRYDRWTYKEYGKFAVHILFRNGRVVKLVQGKR